MPDISIFDQIGQQIISRMTGGGSPYGAQVTGSGGITSPQTSFGELERARDSYRRGQAPLTGENMKRLAGNMFGIATDPFSTMAATMAERALGLEQGMLGGIQDFEGYIGPSLPGAAMINKGYGVGAAQSADRGGGGFGAHGGVTGAAGGLKGQQSGGGKKVM